MTEPTPAVDVERARALFANDRCPMPHHGDDAPPLEVIETQKLCHVDNATGTALFLGRQVPVRDMVVVQCSDDDCQWGREIVATHDNGAEQTHAGLGFTDVPVPTVGDGT